ncbi:hypothetical protein WDU94_014885 [Cyamophila willieti]
MQAAILCAVLCTLIPCFIAQNINEDQEETLHSLSTEQRPAKQRYGQVYSRTKHTHRGMVQALCKHGHIYSESVRNAMLRVDRANFFSKPVNDPYKIKSRQIGFGADISSGHIHAQMLELLKDKIKPGARILDIGSGSGYLTACLAYLAGPNGKVFGVEHVMELAEASIKNIDKGNSELLDQGRVQFVVWNGKHGYEREAPYDIIHVSPSYYSIPQKLLDQLVPGGRMIMPVGEPFKGQNLTMIDKLADGYTIVTTVVRKVRTNPLYRDRFQQKKYYNELRRKAQERYNNTLATNFSKSHGGFRNKVTYVFKTEGAQGEQQHHEQHEHHDQGEDFDHSMSRDIDEQQAERNQKGHQNQNAKIHADKEVQQSKTAPHFGDSTTQTSVSNDLRASITASSLTFATTPTSSSISPTVFSETSSTSISSSIVSDSSTVTSITSPIDPTSSTTSIDRTPISITISEEGSSTSSSRDSSSTPCPLSSFKCKCNKTYKSESWYNKHIAACKEYQTL